MQLDPNESTSNSDRTGQAYLLFAASLLLVITLGTVTQLRSMLFGLGFTELVLILLPAILFVRWKRLPVAEALRWKPVAPTTVLLSVAVGITGWGVAAGIFVLSLPILGEPPTVEALSPRTLPDLIWVLFFAALLPGICEESLFRGAIQGVLERKGKKMAVIITGLLFAVYHVNPWILVPGFFLGIVFGTLVVRTGSTLPAVLAHLANNAVAFTVTYFYHDQPETKAYMLMGGLAAACLVTFPVFWLGTRGTETEPSLLASVPAGVKRPGLWVLGLFGGTILALIIGAVLAVFLLIGFHTVESEKLGPDIRTGDQLVIFKGGMVELDLEVGDIISYRSDGGMELQKIVRLEEENVWFLKDGIERRLLRKEIAGKVVHVIKASELQRPD